MPWRGHCSGSPTDPPCDPPLESPFVYIFIAQCQQSDNICSSTSFVTLLGSSPSLYHRPPTTPTPATDYSSYSGNPAQVDRHTDDGSPREISSSLSDHNAQNDQILGSFLEYLSCAVKVRSLLLPCGPHSAAAPAGGRRRVNTATAEREHVPLALKLPSSGPLVNSQTGGSCLQICSTWQHCCSVCSSAGPRTSSNADN